MLRSIGHCFGSRVAFPRGTSQFHSHVILDSYFLGLRQKYSNNFPS